MVFQYDPPPQEEEEELSHLEEQEQGLLSFEHASHVINMPDSFLEEHLAEKLLTEELNRLSLVEHEKILFDIHGFSQVDQEDPVDVEVRLQEIEKEIGKIRNKKAYDYANYCNPDYVQDRSFRLKFLRCDRWDTKLAAQRIVRHFQVKQELFGETDVMARDVRLSDLSSDDSVALESGFIQVLPTRDVAGRSIFSIAPMHRPDHCSIQSCARALWYIFNTTMNDEDAQRIGVVGILSNFGQFARREPFALMKQIQGVRSGIPKKIVGIHYCYDDAALKPFIAGVRLFLTKEMRTRFRPHFGDRDNITFELQTYGIPTEDHPILQNGALSLEWHRQWLQVRRTQEQSESTKDGMILPRRFDVLFGRGRNTREHTGNLRAIHLVEMHLPEYERAGKFKKTEIAERIVTIIQESFGRFLKWEDKGWVEVDAEAAREKISHFFRHLRTKTTVKEDDVSFETSTKSEQSATGKRDTPSVSPCQPVAEGMESGKAPKVG